MDKKILEDYISQGYTKKAIAKELQCSYSTVRNYCKKYNIAQTGYCRKSKERIEMGEEVWRQSRSSAMTDKVVKSRQKKKLLLMEYKGGQCEICGYNTHIPAVYDFHHIDPTIKEFSISGHTTKCLDKLKVEADKCMLLCKNCHAELHYNDYIAKNTN